MKKTIFAAFVCFLSVVLFMGVASAHVVVYPQETTQGTYEKFTVRVPSEKEGTSTLKVEVKIPADVNISRVEPKTGWEYALERDDTDKITSVTWESTGEGLSRVEFAEFNLQGKVGDQATSIEWKSYQTYADGEVVEWVGTDGSDKPASVSIVKPKDDQAADEQENSGSLFPIILSFVSLILAGLALIAALARKK